MSKKFYVVCDDNCRSEGMNKEQIYEVLAKNIPAARTEGDCLILELDGIPIPGDDSGFITTLKETNAGKGVSLWVGTEAEFNAIFPAVEADSVIARVDANGKVYICKDDSFLAFLKNTIQPDKIMVGAEELDAALVAKLRNGGADAFYEIENVAGLKSALIEQASSMGAGTERMVYFHDEAAGVFFPGGAIAKLYHHASVLQGSAAYVCVEIYSADEIYYMVVSKNKSGTWVCTDWKKITTSNEFDALTDDLRDNYYTSKQVDTKISDVRDDCTGIEREFEADVNAASYTYSGKKSKFYIVEVGNADDSATFKDRVVTFTIDFRMLSTTAKVFTATFYPYALSSQTPVICELWVQKTSNESGVIFKCYGRDGSGEQIETLEIKKICGYY